MPLEENRMEKQRCRRRMAEMEAGMVDLCQADTNPSAGHISKAV
jgi:hypothetical protein